MADLGRLTGEAFLGFAAPSGRAGGRSPEKRRPTSTALTAPDLCSARRLRGSVAFSVLFASLLLAGCMSEDVLHFDGVTTAAGDAIAANTVMQMVDPWPAGVEDTRFATPFERPGGTIAASPPAIVDLSGGNTRN